MNTNCYLESRDRVRHGRHREQQIVTALIEQCNLLLKDATDAEDKEQKIDRWLLLDNQRIPVQIKYRETGDDLLVEVFDRWNGFNVSTNKIGRDMIGSAKLYLVLKKDRSTVIMTQCSILKSIIQDMLDAAQIFGWTLDKSSDNKVLKYHKSGGKCELKVQADPRDGRAKMIAYIPANVLEYHAIIYKINLPKHWSAE